MPQSKRSKQPEMMIAKASAIQCSFQADLNLAGLRVSNRNSARESVAGSLRTNRNKASKPRTQRATGLEPQFGLQSTYAPLAQIAYSSKLRGSTFIMALTWLEPQFGHKTRVRSLG